MLVRVVTSELLLAGTMAGAASMDSAAPMRLYYWGSMAKGLGPAIVAEVSGLPWQGPGELGFDADEEWPAMKASGRPPFGQLPLLEDGPLHIGHSAAIASYIGRKAGMEGEGLAEFAVSQMLLGEGEDLYANMLRFNPTCFAALDTPRGPPGAQWPTGGLTEHEVWWADGVPQRVERWEALLLVGRDRFTSSGQTAGELYFFAMLHQLVLCRAAALAGTPGVAAFYARVAALPAVARVLRGQSPFGTFFQYFISEESDPGHASLPGPATAG